MYVTTSLRLIGTNLSLYSSFPLSSSFFPSPSFPSSPHFFSFLFPSPSFSALLSSPKLPSPLLFPFSLPSSYSPPVLWKVSFGPSPVFFVSLPGVTTLKRPVLSVHEGKSPSGRTKMRHYTVEQVTGGTWISQETTNCKRGVDSTRNVWYKREFRCV